MIEMMQADQALWPREQPGHAGSADRWSEMPSGGGHSGPAVNDRPAVCGPAGNTQAQRNARRKVEKALEFMLQHLDRNLPVPMLSAMAGLSTSNFYLLFKLGTGFTPNDLHIRARMCRACALLRETDLSVKEVANRLGYDDQYYFSRLFKLVNGLPPREYRARMSKPEFSRIAPVDRLEASRSAVPSVSSRLSPAP